MNAWKYLEMIDERSSSPILKNKNRFLSPRRESNQHEHVRASHQSSEGWGFDPRMGLRNRFSEDGV